MHRQHTAAVSAPRLKPSAFGARGRGARQDAADAAARSSGTSARRQPALLPFGTQHINAAGVLIRALAKTRVLYRAAPRLDFQRAAAARVARYRGRERLRRFTKRERHFEMLAAQAQQTRAAHRTRETGSGSVAPATRR